MARRRRRRHRKSQQLISTDGPKHTKLPRMVLPEQSWLALRTIPHGERRVQQAVDAIGNELGIAFYRPLYALRIVQRHRIVTVLRSGCPGYVFVGANDADDALDNSKNLEAWLEHRFLDHVVLATYGPIQTDALQIFCDHLTGYAGQLEPDLPYLARQHVVIQDGPLAGLPAIVVGMLEHASVLVTANFFGRHVRASVDVLNLRAA